MAISISLRRGVCAALALLTLLLPCAFAEEQEEPLYVENEWNYVDQSMDATQGIPEDAVGVMERIQRTGVLRVATEPYFPPQEFIDPNLTGQESYVGADMEMARLIATRMGVALEIVPMEFTEVLDAVADGTCDLAISGLAFTPARAAMVELSKGYHYTENNAGSGLLIRASDAEKITSAEDLNGLNLVAQSGSLQESIVAEHIRNYHEFKRMSSILECYTAVQRGRADAAAVDIENALSYIENNPDCGLALVPGVRMIQEEQYDGDRVAAKKGELQLIYFVNSVIDELLASNQYAQWFEEYQAYAAKLGM